MNELNELILEVIGEDHPISQMLDQPDAGLEITDVMLAVLTALVERIKKLEERKVH